jgi:hypothetical protein
MRKLRIAFEPLVKKAAQAEELAFHFADIKDELVLVSKILDKIAKKGHASNADFERLMTVVGVHWPYHVSRIKRTFAKIESSTEPEEAEAKHS